MWAQRKDNVYVTLSLSDCTDANVDITEDHLKFKYVPVLFMSVYRFFPLVARSPTPPMDSILNCSPRLFPTYVINEISVDPLHCLGMQMGQHRKSHPHCDAQGQQGYLASSDKGTSVPQYPSIPLGEEYIEEQDSN